MPFKVKFYNDQNFIGNVKANENMEFIELINIFLKNNGFSEYHKATFYFHSKKINRNSVKQLKELGIKANSVIEVKKQNLVNDSNNTENIENLQIPQNNNMSMDMNMINNKYGNMAINMDYNPIKYLNLFMMNYGFMNMGQNMQNYGNMFMNQKDSNNQNINCTKDNTHFYNIIFNYSGKIYTIQGLKNNKFCEIVTKFCNKAGLEDRNLMFISNSRMIHDSETRTLEKLGIRNYSKIEAVSYLEVIGA